MSQHVSYFENLRAMPAAGPFVVCHVRATVFRVEVAPAGGVGAPRAIGREGLAALARCGMADVYRTAASAEACADRLNAQVSAGSIDAEDYR